ncbi:carboxylesterase/lipase family protein [Bacillus sp. Marseille-P3661]|uniref:carboxylesterase/lipase family protein n=1 Tax=Bacillus sp. Marseille-P3661 TaxID=1936234 RepID=UPI000C83054C|nr:carboxylesterase/lipase family protein [Bacillus sp. Marseille-P3661]
MVNQIVEITSGKIRGEVTDGIYSFKGIPYGEGTDGSRRFLPPSKMNPWTGIYNATEYGPRCFQTKGNINPDNELTKAQSSIRIREEASENCLFLNVWTSGLNDGGRRPVLFWCHGGGFFQGSGAGPRTDGTSLAKNGEVVVITVNHRLGPLGYLFLGDLIGGQYDRSGNVGMLDLVLALEWVQENVEVFGGDPNNVTIFGCSGGGSKVSTLMAMPAAKGLFHRAIIQSAYGLKMSTREDATEIAEKVLNHLGVSEKEIDRLHTVPVESLWEAYHVATAWTPERFAEKGRHIAISPVVDGYDLPQHPFDPVGSPLSADVPLMIGTTKDEATLFLFSDPDLGSIDEVGLRKWASLYFGEGGEHVIAAYRNELPHLSANDLLISIISDRVTIRDSITLAERKLAQQAAAVYMYQFTWESPILGGKMKSMHGLEVPFVFNNVHRMPFELVGEDPDKYTLASNMSQAWISFARNGNPGHAGLPTWSSYSTIDRSTMIFGKECHVVKDPGRVGRLTLN